MLCSIGHGEIPNLNFWFAPSCRFIGALPLNHQILKQQNRTSFAFSPFINNKLFATPFLPRKSQIILPKTVDVKIIESDTTEAKENIKINKEKNCKKLFEISSCETNHDTISDESTHDHDHFLENSVDLNFITENDITRFNNDQNLKKIHSTYHLKRKVSTKFQNQVKVQANNLIMECNKYLPQVKIPFLSPFTKVFREDVKIDTFKRIKNCTIDKYINEDIQSAGRSLNIKNSKVIELIKDIIEKYEDNNDHIKKLKKFFFKTVVIDYYNEFLESNNFISYLEKDLQKYSEKLKSLNYSEEKIQLYKKIFKEKYEGIAKYLFYSD